jgi:hypothetical protein
MAAEPCHIVLAGDSIFDNDVYVLGEPGVIEQMRQALPKGWSAFKIAVDGDCIRDVPAQLARLPTHATDLVLSIGGNDMIGYSGLLEEVRNPAALMGQLQKPLAEFAAAYGELLDRLAKLPVKVTVCTVYTAIPFHEPQFRRHGAAAIGVFNGIIVGEAGKRGMEVIRLEQVCTEAGDFSAVSPIEPSAAGGRKIVAAILGHLGAN